jgi:hypothetical protein
MKSRKKILSILITLCSIGEKVKKYIAQLSEVEFQTRAKILNEISSEDGMGDEKNSHIFLADTKMGILIITV